MIFTIINLPPMPRNRSHRVARNMLIKTDLAREFEKDLTNRLLEFKDDFNAFKNLGSSSDYLRAVYTIYTPGGSLFTKEGKISIRAVDTDGHKLFQDVIFKCLGLDDKLIRHLEVYTPESKDDTWNYRVSLEWKNISELRYQDSTEDTEFL